jgi:hypothetical protein
MTVTAISLALPGSQNEQPPLQTMLTVLTTKCRPPDDK